MVELIPWCIQPIVCYPFEPFWELMSISDNNNTKEEREAMREKLRVVESIKRGEQIAMTTLYKQSDST